MIARTLALAFTATAWALAGSASYAQGLGSVTTDKPVYGYGEPIGITYTIHNTTTDTLSLYYPDCTAAFAFDDFDVVDHRGCTLESGFVVIAPGHAVIWTWRIEPEKHGLPTTSGTHTVVGYFPRYPELSDTLTVEAPQYRGGRVEVAIKREGYPASVQPLKDSLNVEVLSSFPLSDVQLETWQIEGVPVDSMVAAYGADPRFTSLRVAGRQDMHEEQTVSNEEPVAVSAGPPVTIYPNPFGRQGRLLIRVSEPQHVRVGVYDLLGRRVAVLLDEWVGPGEREVPFEAGWPSGTYVARVETAGGAYTLQVVRVE